MPRPYQTQHDTKHLAGLVLIFLTFLLSLFLPLRVSARARLIILSAQQQTNPNSTVKDDKDIRVLEPGKPVERELGGGRLHVYRITLVAGEYMHIAVEQRGVDVMITLRGPDGASLIEMDGLPRTGGEEDLSWEVIGSGLYTVEVHPRVQYAQKGGYKVSLNKAPRVTDRERTLISAQQLYVEGVRAQAGSGAEWVEATQKYQAAAEKWQAAGERKWRGRTLNNLGFVYNSLGQYDKAREYLDQALAISRDVKDRLVEGWTLNNLGFVSNNLAQYEKAPEYLEQALAISREVKDRRGEGEALGNLGISNWGLSQYGKALEFFEQVRAIFHENKDKFSEGISLNNIGYLYRYLGENEKALNYLEQGLAVFRELENRVGEGTTLDSLGDLHNNLGQYDKARAYLERALALSRETKDRGVEAAALSHLGEVYINQRQYEGARVYLEQALSVAREIKDRLIESHALSHLGEVSRHLNQNENSREYFEQALAIRREINDRDGEGETLSNMMMLWEALARPRLAIFYGKQAINTFQHVRANIRGLEQQSQQSFVLSKAASYRQLADLLISEGRLPEAQQVLSMLKEEEYFDFVRRSGDEASALNRRAALTPTEAEWERRYREVADRVAEAGRRRGELLEKKERTSEEERQLAGLESELATGGQAFQQFLDRLAAETADTKQAAKVEQLRESQGLMEDLRELGQGAVALYTVVGQDRYRVILVTPEVQLAREYPIKAADLNRKVLAFREVLQNPTIDPVPQAQELHGILVGPLEKDLGATGARTLMWSLDGVLRYLPVSALHDGRQYLVEKYRNVVFTLASQARLKDRPIRSWNGLGLGVSKRQGEMSPLPSVRAELQSIFREQEAAQAPATEGVLPGKVMLDEAFTEQTMRVELRRRYPVVHIASHFKFKPGNETDSFLLLGDGEYFTLDKVKAAQNLFGGVELLTLSACDTATGGAGADGKEVEGFGVLAQRQGAKAVLATLWAVEDRSTSLLMRSFYRRRMAQPDAPKAEALRRAQVGLLMGEAEIAAGNGGPPAAGAAGSRGEAPSGQRAFRRDPQARFSHPYYWAPFILIGNWR